MFFNHDISLITKDLIPTEMSNGQSDNIKRHLKVRLYSNCVLTSDGGLSNYSHPTGVVNRFTGRARNSRLQTRKMRVEIQFCELKI